MSIQLIQMAKQILFNPVIAFSIFVGFIVLYLVFLDVEGAFTQGFLEFGPSKDAKFLNMKLDT